MEQYKCRTCLDIVDIEKCTEISKTCYLDQTIKEIIILLVPTMVSTLSDDELICKNCLKVVKSTVKFIERCLVVEKLIGQNKDQEEEFENYDLSDCAENISEDDEETILLIKPSEKIDQDHDYYVKYEPVDSDGIKIENSDENYVKIEQIGDSRPIEIIFDSSMVNMEDANASSDIPIQILFDDSSTCNESTSENIPDGEIDNLETYDDTTSDMPLEDIKYEEELNSENSVENQELSCQTCSQEFSSRYEYDMHLEIHPAFVCEHCEKGFKSEYHYKRHLKIHQECVKICEICGKLFKNDTALSCHKNEVHDKIVYMCDQCPKVFKNKFRLSGHMRMVHEKSEQQHQCQCGKLFHRKESWENHYRLVHLQLKPFVCDVCGREFGRKDYLQKHMYYHTGEPRPVQHRNKMKSKNSRGKPPKFGIRLKDPGTPVNCKICGKLILSVHLLKSHLQSHVKIKRHKCRYCELTFTLSNNRDRHQRIHEADPEKKFRCNICWKKMKTEAELEHHIVGHYNRPPQHSCDICGEKFHRKYLLDNHHLDKHTDPGDIERAEKEIVIDNLLEYAHPNDLYDG